MLNKFKIISYVQYQNEQFNSHGGLSINRNEYTQIVETYKELVQIYCNKHNYAYEFNEIADNDNSELQDILDSLSNYSELDNSKIDMQLTVLALYKLKYIYNVLNRNEDEYVVFLDTDAIPSNPNIKLEEFIDDEHELFLNPGNKLYQVYQSLNNLMSKFNILLKNENNILTNCIENNKLLYNQYTLLELMNEFKFNLFTASNEGFIIVKNTNKMKQLFSLICKNYYLGAIRNKSIALTPSAEGKLLGFFLENEYFFNTFKYMPEYSMGHYYGMGGHKYDVKTSFLLHNYSVMNIIDRCKCFEIMKHNMWWKPILNNTNNNSFLIMLNDLGLGDIISSTSFFKDFYEQYPDKSIYVTIPAFFNKQYNDRFVEVFKNNPYVKIWNGEPIDKIIEFKNSTYLQETKTNDAYSMGTVLYLDFNNQTNLHVIKNTNSTILSLTDDEKSDNILKKFNINTSKPIGIINFGINIIYNTSKLQDKQKLQNIINATSNKIFWIQVGQDFNYANFKLDNCLNLINQTSIRELFSLIYHSQYIVCPLTSLIHIAAMDEIKNNIKKTVFVLSGTRENINWYNNYNSINLHFLNYDPIKYKTCLKENEKCCICDITCINEYNKNLNLKLCKNIDYSYNPPIPKCLSEIDENIIINKIYENNSMF